MTGAVCRCCVVLLLTAMLAGCSDHRPAASAAGGMTLLYSPNGEPLAGGPLGHPGCRDAMAQWFDRVDANGDGKIDLDEFLADAARQFAVMDLDHDGIVTPAALAAYRAPFYGAASQPADAAPPASGEHRHRRGGEGAPRASGGEDQQDQADPVMLADTTLRFRVSSAEFLAYARRHFAQLDAVQRGSLAKLEILQICGKDDDS
jgi:hypothetical protein